MRADGFTLIELMIVVAVIGILSAIGAANYATLQRKAGDAFTKGNLGTVRSALSIYYSDNIPLYPSDDLACLAYNAKYLEGIPLVRIKPTHLDNSTVTTEVTPTETGTWSYNNSEASTTWGTLSVGCLHTDTKGVIWSNF
jgi:prepilin-type N-terminal cleavage/methylation domain-containing protein